MLLLLSAFSAASAASAVNCCYRFYARKSSISTARNTLGTVGCGRYREMCLWWGLKNEWKRVISHLTTRPFVPYSLVEGEWHDDTISQPCK